MINQIIDIIKTHSPNTSGVSRHSAILIPLIERNDELHILYERRAFSLKTQPGEICFPGGALEDKEHPMEAAIRETCEELNIDESHIDIIGQVDSVLTSFDMIIHCYVGLIKTPFDDIQFSRDEVDQIFTVPIEYFIDHPPKTYVIKSKFEIEEDFPYENIPNGKGYNFKTMAYPVVFYDYEAFTIWGLTARMTESFVKLISNTPKKHE